MVEILCCLQQGTQQRKKRENERIRRRPMAQRIGYWFEYVWVHNASIQRLVKMKSWHCVNAKVDAGRPFNQYWIYISVVVLYDWPRVVRIHGRCLFVCVCIIDGIVCKRSGETVISSAIEDVCNSFDYIEYWDSNLSHIYFDAIKVHYMYDIDSINASIFVWDDISRHPPSKIAMDCERLTSTVTSIAFTQWTCLKWLKSFIDRWGHFGERQCAKN